MIKTNVQPTKILPSVSAQQQPAGKLIYIQHVNYKGEDIITDGTIIGDMRVGWYSPHQQYTEVVDPSRNWRYMILLALGVVVVSMLFAVCLALALGAFTLLMIQRAGLWLFAHVRGAIPR